jgi:5-methyltetrahydropteroyltriglutamate--homocysteine methyltransferase
VGNATIERPPKLGVVGKLRRRRFLSVEEFVYARARTDRTSSYRDLLGCIYS